MTLQATPRAPSLSYASDELPPVSQHIVQVIEKLTGQPRIKDLYDSYAKLRRPPEEFWNDAVRVLRLRIDLNRSPAEALPASGALVVVANHPFGVVDGLVLCWLVSQVRDDYRIMTHRILHQAPEVRNLVLPVDFSGTKAALSNNIESRQRAREILAAGGVLIVFPSGAVAFSKKFFGRAVDLEWKSLAATLALASGADVLPVYFSGQNGRLFQMAANIHLTLEYSLLFHEVRNKIGSRISATVGQLIPSERLRAIGDCRAATEFLKQATPGLAAKR